MEHGQKKKEERFFAVFFSLLLLLFLLYFFFPAHFSLLRHPHYLMPKPGWTRLHCIPLTAFFYNAV